MKPPAARWMRLLPTALVGAIFCARIAGAADVNCSFHCEAYDYRCPDIIITSQADSDQWGACGNVTGNVVIQSNSLTNISLNGFQNIYNGGLIVANCTELVEISAPNLQLIAQNLTLSNLPQLTTIVLPILFNVGGILWDSLPLFTNATVATVFDPEDYNVAGMGPYELEIEMLWITNTGLDNLDVLGPYLVNIVAFQVTDNPNLNNISFPTLKSVSSMDIARNGPATVLDVPAMAYSSNVSISNVANVAISNFSTMDYGNGDLIFTDNSFQTIIIYQLGNMEGSLEISNNSNLTTLDFSSLYSVNDNLVIEGNPLLQTLSLPTLGSVWGAMNLTGNFSNVSCPVLTQFPPIFHLNSTSATFDCVPFDKGNYDYITEYQKYQRTTSLPSGYSYSCSAYPPGSTKDTAYHWHWKKPLSSAAKDGLIAMGVVLGILIIIGVNRWYRWKHPHPKSRETAGAGAVMPLEEVSGGVVRAEDGEDGDHPPNYARVGRGDEVPPGYESSLHSSTAVAPQDTATEPLHFPPEYDAVSSVQTTKKKKKKGYGSRIWSGIQGRPTLL